ATAGRGRLGLSGDGAAWRCPQYGGRTVVRGVCHRVGNRRTAGNARNRKRAEHRNQGGAQMNRRNWYLIMNGLIGLWLVAAAVVVVAHQIRPAGGWLTVHLLLLGAVSTAILVWSQHFADTLLRRPAKGGRAFHAARLATHTFGAAAVIAGVAAGVSVLAVG